MITYEPITYFKASWGDWAMILQRECIADNYWYYLRTTSKLYWYLKYVLFIILYMAVFKYIITKCNVLYI